MKKLSIIVPVYNVEKYLNKCITSILNQTFRDFELILIDDGSTDNSVKICEGFAKVDERVRILKSNHIGAGEARNLGLATSTGEYITFIDSDDWIDKLAYETLFNILQSKDYDLLMFGNIDIIYDKTEKKIIKQNYVIGEGEYLTATAIRSNFCDILFNTQFNVPWNKIYRTSIIKNNNILFPKYVRAQDAFFNMEYIKHIEKFKIIPETFYYYRVNDKLKVWKKFPRDLINIDIDYDKFIVDMLTDWGKFYGENKKRIDNLFVNSVYKTIGFYRNPLWKMNRKEKEKYILKIINCEYIKYRFKNIYDVENRRKRQAVLDCNIFKIKKIIKEEMLKNFFYENKLFKALQKLKKLLKKGSKL